VTTAAAALDQTADRYVTVYDVAQLSEMDRLRARNDEIAEKLDRTLVASERLKRELHNANGRAQRLVCVLEMQIRELRICGDRSGSDALQAELTAALEGV
jgi:hypothetical protein